VQRASDTCCRDQITLAGNESLGRHDTCVVVALHRLSPAVHTADGVFLDEDIWGQESIVDCFKSQWDRYDCQHEPLLAAGSDHVPANFSGCAFSFWQDKV